MTTNTAGLSLKEAAAQAEAELALAEESTEPASPVALDAPVLEVEQPAVENPVEEGLLDVLAGEASEQPETESQVVEVDGVEVTLDELRNGYMRQADYTRKTQELAEEKREAEKALTLLRLLEERPVETVRKLYQTINSGETPSSIVEATQNISELKTPAESNNNSPTDIEALVEARVAEMLNNDPRLKELQQEKALDEVNRIFGDIEKVYKVKLTDADKQRVLEEAVRLNTDDLRFVFGGLLNEANVRKLELANAKKAAPVVPEYVPPVDEGPVVPEKFENFRSALKATMAAEQAAVSQL